jgi:alkyl hydroperoxide reductase subunit AhpC
VEIERLRRVTERAQADDDTRIDHQDATNVDSKGIAFTIRSVFVIDPKKTIRTILSYPASTGRNTAEVLRIVDSLQTGDKHRVTTPINWVPGKKLWRV